ncbi:MAG TPA: VWA domain-containing protein [Amaricoccus sp.]|uniref:VWA domain-containing protein n=1 Tax=Amaricoccus sp. TaxID=1872485 RepID=UPI002C6C8534|nr:VWA domain-containing protein [Amaricoccus sp.]HMQ95427.1 VWA domain-containing protein [Amaricoccus sp.]HMR52959.1 VWA domain-containing protein [Amaricoccus sp.]HMR62134.1 VWA domain-containing protein [Amaricoccus sp.]HMT99854.1 VWA domain-containing protein [Amaricoccus sp.]
MSKRNDLPTKAPRDTTPAGPVSSKAEMAAFLAEARHAGRGPAGGRGRLIFALDATMSRQPTWDLACHLQAGLFEASARVGGLDVQLAYFRGHGEARASRWVRDAAALTEVMSGITCRGGLTQIGKILDHAEKVAAQAPLAALVYVGDAMEEDIDRLCHKAGRLALRNTRAFMFLEGGDATAERAYREIARLTGGVFLPFDPRAAAELRALLEAIGAFAAGGRVALEAQNSTASSRLLADLRP